MTTTITVNLKKSTKKSVVLCTIENLYYIHIQNPSWNTSKPANQYLTGSSLYNRTFRQASAAWLFL